MHKLGVQSKAFSDKVSLMNKTGSRLLTMTANEARDLHNEIVGLLATVVELSNAASQKNNNVIGPSAGPVEIGGGYF